MLGPTQFEILIYICYFTAAPCNLRYGYEDTNYRLGDKVDPMGTRQDTRPGAIQLISLTDKGQLISKCLFVVFNYLKNRI